MVLWVDASLADGQPHMMSGLEASLEERKERGVHRSRTTEHKIAMNRVSRGAGMGKQIVPTTRSDEAGKTRILIRKGRADPLESVRKIAEGGGTEEAKKSSNKAPGGGGTEGEPAA